MRGESVATATVITAVTGIVVSGIVGPMALAWSARRASRQQFGREFAARRRDELRTVLDQAAELLGVGVTNLRVAAEADQTGQPQPADVRDWAGAVHLLEQRLLLRLPLDHAVVTAYRGVRAALVSLGEAGGAQNAEEGITAFEAARAAFLDEARKALDAPFPKDAKS